MNISFNSVNKIPHRQNDSSWAFAIYKHENRAYQQAHSMCFQFQFLVPCSLSKFQK